MAKRVSKKSNPNPETSVPTPAAVSTTPAAETIAAETTKPVSNVEARTEPKIDTKTDTKKIIRKPEIVKSEPRANIVPINLEEEIRRLAYLLSERRGFEPGHEAEDWIAAEREVRQRYHQQSA
ncbi:MAG TPA: DUF2934 domain-containing protein [Candidatus Sulfotelmatobacter sp.]|jgi:hypothetical protein|nr:DUF2934 domain-containing protein [Candidatus Sulfotelmatobacter sp.]